MRTPFIFGLARPTIIRSCIIDGRYKDLANVAFTDPWTTEVIYKKLFPRAYRNDILVTDVDTRPGLQEKWIQRLGRVFQFLQTLLDWFQGHDEQDIDDFNEEDYVYFIARAMPNPGWSRYMAPWDIDDLFDIELCEENRTFPRFAPDRSYSVVWTGERLGDRAICSNNNYYRSPVVTIKLVDWYGNCQATRKTFESSHSWFMIRCLLQACLGEQAGIYFVIDQYPDDDDDTFAPRQNILFEEDPQDVINSQEYKSLFE